jgi:hypothetical protein
MTDEEWRDIPNWAGRYQVSNLGRVRGVKGMLRPNVMRNGYLCVHLYSGGKHTRKPVTIHKLVASVFLDSAADEVNHINFDRADNRAVNLEWVTRLDNVRHAVAAGRRGDTRKKVKATDCKTGEVRVFIGQKAAEVALRGRPTGFISHALSTGRPAYGCYWSRA